MFYKREPGAYLVKENLDGSFSSRHHFLDGSTWELGVFLYNNISTEERVDWVFGLDRSFFYMKKSRDILTETGLRGGDTISEYYSSSGQRPNLVVEYPPLFGHLRNEIFISANQKTSTDVLNNISWEEISQLDNEIFLYFFSGGKWNIILDISEKIEHSVFIDAKKCAQYEMLVVILEGMPGASLEDISRYIKEEKAGRNNTSFEFYAKIFSNDFSPSHLKSILRMWTIEDEKTKTSFTNYMRKFLRRTTKEMLLFDKMAGELSGGG